MASCSPFSGNRYRRAGRGGIRKSPDRQRRSFVGSFPMPGRGVFDCADGQLLVRDYDADEAWPEGPELRCSGIGPLADDLIMIAGLYGGGLHRTTDDGWAVDVVAPDWPTERIVLSEAGSNLMADKATTGWRQVRREDFFQLHAYGFSPSGRTLVVATSGS